MARNQADVTSELQRMSRLLALVAIKDIDESDGIRVLARAGYSYREIGELIGMTANAVELRLRRQRTGKKANSRKVKESDGK